MKSNKLIIIFLVKFFGSYALLFTLYSVYLSNNQVKTEPFSCAPITETVAKQTKFLLNTFGYNADIEQHPDEISIMLLIDNHFIARVIEGCNSVSIIILFIAFIIAFSNGFKKTSLYILFGSFIIYAVNIIRIAIITVTIYKYPKYQFFLHELLFPSIIYGTTFLLWFIWIQKFSKLKK